jgi:predicted enzyme related to lactoylglutathione lyase
MPNPITLTVFPVKDLEKAKVLYTAFLGVEPYYASEYYAGYKLGDQEIGLDPNSQIQVTYIDVEDLEVAIGDLGLAGATLHVEPKNVGGGLMIAQVKDADGNVLGLRQK